MPAQYRYSLLVTHFEANRTNQLTIGVTDCVSLLLKPHMMIGHEYIFRWYLLGVLIDFSQQVHLIVAILYHQLTKTNSDSTNLPHNNALHLQAGVLLGEDLIVKLT